MNDRCMRLPGVIFFSYVYSCIWGKADDGGGGGDSDDYDALYSFYFSFIVTYNC